MDMDIALDPCPSTYIDAALHRFQGTVTTMGSCGLTGKSRRDTGRAKPEKQAFGWLLVAPMVVNPALHALDGELCRSNTV